MKRQPPGQIVIDVRGFEDPERLRKFVEELGPKFVEAAKAAAMGSAAFARYTRALEEERVRRGVELERLRLETALKVARAERRRKKIASLDYQISMAGATSGLLFLSALVVALTPSWPAAFGLYFFAVQAAYEARECRAIRDNV